MAVRHIGMARHPGAKGDDVNTLTITLPEERIDQLKETAARLGVAPEELARAGIEDLLAYPEESFQQLLDRLLEKNARLYLRLATQ